VTHSSSVERYLPTTLSWCQSKGRVPLPYTGLWAGKKPGPSGFCRHLQIFRVPGITGGRLIPTPGPQPMTRLRRRIAKAVASVPPAAGFGDLFRLSKTTLERQNLSQTVKNYARAPMIGRKLVAHAGKLTGPHAPGDSRPFDCASTVFLKRLRLRFLSRRTAEADFGTLGGRPTCSRRLRLVEKVL
jgi:hypothetical protein